MTGIPVSNIVIAATHNHGSPEYWGPLRDLAHEASVTQQGSDPHEAIDYQQELVDAWSGAIKSAYDFASPATMEVYMAQQSGVAFNRRFHMRDGSVQFNPGYGNPDIVRPAGPVDSDLPVVLFRQLGMPGNSLVSLTTFAMHTAVDGGGTEFTADFPAVLQRQLQQRYGADFVSIFAEGTAGDINHIDVNNRHQLRGSAEAARIGKLLAETVIRALGKQSDPTIPQLAMTSQTVFAPFQHVSEGRYLEAIDLLKNQQTARVPFLELVAAWRDCHRYHHAKHYGASKPLEVQAIRLSADTAMVTLPHEVFVETGLAIKACSPFRNTIVISLANDVDYYVPTRRAFEEGSYEVTTCPLDPGCGELLLDAARQALATVKGPENIVPKAE